MKKTLKVVFISLLVCATKGYSQQNITDSESINGTTVSYTMDSRIQNLLTKSEELCSQPKGLTSTATSSTANTKTTTAPSKSDLSVSEVCRQMPKLSGFKILVSTVNNATDANNIRYQVRQNFPDLRTELDSSLRPNYKVLAGSFFSTQSGQADLKRVRTVWKDARLIPYRIFCAESK